MSKKFLVFTFLFIFAFFTCGPAHAQILSSFFGRGKPTPPPVPQTNSALVPEASDIAAAVAARAEMLQSLMLKSQCAVAIENQNPVAQVGYNVPAVLQEPVPMPMLRPVFLDQKIEDERQITAEFRMLTGTPEIFAPTGFTPENGWQFMPQNTPRYHEGSSGLEHSETVEAASISVTNSAMSFRFIDQKNTTELMDHFQGNPRCNVFQAPKITVFNEQPCTISDITQSPFTTSVNPVAVDSKVYYQPVVTMLEEGMRLTFCAKIQEDGSIFMKQCHFQLSKITNRTETVTFPVENGETVTLQTPSINSDCINMSITIPPGKSLLVAIPGIKRLVEKTESKGIFGKTTAREKQMVCLMITPQIIDEESTRMEEVGPNLYRTKKGELLESYDTGEVVKGQLDDGTVLEANLIGFRPVQEKKTDQYKSEDLRQVADEWERFWLFDQPNPTPINRENGNVLMFHSVMMKDL